MSRTRRWCIPGLFWLIVSAAVAGSAAHAAVVLDRENAVGAVVSELALADITVAWCPYADYGSGAGFEGVLPAGTTVRPVEMNTLPHPGNVVTLAGPSYLFMVDEQPNAAFTHRVHFVYVDATVASPSLAGGTILVQEQGWWPVIQRPSLPAEELFGADDRTSALPGAFDNPDGLVFGTYVPPFPARRPLPDSQIAPGAMMANNCAIVASGVAAGAAGTAESGLTGSANDMFTQLQNRGVPVGRIQNIRNTNKAGLRAAVTAMCNAAPPCDKIYVFIASHGSDGGICLGSDGSVSADSLCAILKPLGMKKVPVCLMIEACHSGSLVPALRPKFPTGVIITSASKDSVCWTDTVDGQGEFGFFYYAFRQCWNAAAADSDGSGSVDWAEAYKWVCNGNNGQVPWHGHNWDVKTRGPALTGLPDKTHRWQAPASGAWYTDVWRDLDHDGAFDHCDWQRDDDGDGHPEVTYLNVDADEDGINEHTECLRDVDDDGLPDRRYVFEDPEDDGSTNLITCFEWSGLDWLEFANALPRIGPFVLAGSTGGANAGEQPFQLVAAGPLWLNPDVVVFIGSEAHDVQVVAPDQIIGITSGYLVGPRNVIVADFNISSPSYGFYEQTNAYQYVHGDPFIDHVFADHDVCDQPFGLTISGGLFDPLAQVYADGIALPTTWIDSQTLEAEIPAVLCPGLSPGVASDVSSPIAVAVENPNLAFAALVEGFPLAFPKDDFPPDITCPAPLAIEAGPDGLARIPPGFVATASDGEGDVTVVRDVVGALPVGSHAIDFEAIDDAGQRTACTTEIVVGVSNVDPGVIPEHVYLAAGAPNPFTAETALRFGLPRAAVVKLAVYSLSGQRVALLVDREMTAGTHTVQWRGVDGAGHPLESGVYFVQLDAGGLRTTQRVSLLR